MPAWRLDQQIREVRNYDVGGCHGGDARFLTHAVLCLAETPVSVNATRCRVGIVHMGPPLESAMHSIHALGTVGSAEIPLRAGERLQIKAFVDDRLQERKAQQARLSRLSTFQPYISEYIVHPSYVAPCEDVSLWRFSCAGFVMRAYEEANIRLIDVDQLPLVPLETLKRAYPEFASLLDRARMRERVGLGPGESWPVVLVGYLFHSLKRPADQIREVAYVPQSGDENFG